MTIDDMTPATRADLRELETRLEARLDARLDARLSAFAQEIRADLARMMQAIEENFLRMFQMLDDKYDHLPAEVKALRHDVDAHVANAGVHRAPRRTRRARPRS
jgi:hypothetical protein